MIFIETSVFTRLVERLLDDDAYAALQAALFFRPEQGPLIRGSGGLRKLRWASRGRGKRGALRVIYYWEPKATTCYMLFLYDKTQQGDLTAAQIKALRRIVLEEFR